MCVAVSDVLKEAYGDRAQIDYDTLIAGALLADVGKLIEYEEKDGKITKAGRGQHLRHPFTGVAMAHARGVKPEVQHVIATHSKEGEMMIRSNESVIFHHADFIDFDLVSKKRPF
jgi:putative nucleotidyltransferase with HDIG domain